VLCVEVPGRIICHFRFLLYFTQTGVPQREVAIRIM
jgi:hypothetical protein